MKDLKGTPLVFRVDADSEMGTGHLMRCLALAQGWKDSGGMAAFITGCRNEKLLKRLDDEGFLIHKLEKQYPDDGDWALTNDYIAKYSGARVVLDGYHFDENYQKQIKEAGHPLLVIDDMAHLNHYHADIILNQNMDSDKLSYSCESSTRLLLGTKYVLLRREFIKWKNWSRTIPEVARHVLVTIGGSDSGNNTLKVIQALQDITLSGLEAKIIIGAGNLNVRNLEAAVSSTNFPISLIHDARNMPELMAWSDVAVSAGGITSWELAFMGLPNLVLITAENQREVAKSLEKAGIARNLGWYANVNKEKVSTSLQILLTNAEARQVMSRRGQELVDGYGTERVNAALATNGLFLRPVRREDCDFLWKLANDPQVRQVALNSEPIPIEVHTRWFEEKLTSANTEILILEHNSVPVGQIRFDLGDDGVAEIDIAILPAKRNNSLGTYLLHEGTKHYLYSNQECVKSIIGHVRPENIPSCRIFEKAGFNRTETKIINGISLTRFAWPKGAA